VPSSEPDKKQKIKDTANAISKARDCDVVVFNFGLEPMFDYHFLKFLQKRKTKNKNLLLFLTTEGGDADSAYRIGRYLQDAYGATGSISIAVSGWCKSAGTLICIAANELVIFDTGELGPLDVQIAKADELGEQSSGLAAEAAFEKLQQEAFKMFERHLTHIKDDLAGRITFKTAADLSAQLVIGVMKDIFAKIDPLAVGEDYRSNLIAGEYATRLNLAGRNLQDRQHPKALEMLLNGYPSHRFVIDRKEAINLFFNVSEPTSDMITLVDLLGTDALLPRNQRRNQPPYLEFLNDEASKDAKAAPARSRRARSSAKARGPGTVDLPGDISTSPEQEPRKSAA
jgi:hypothetical protein